MTQTDPHVVVGVDHTPSSAAAVRWAAEEALREDTGLLAVHVIDLDDRADLTADLEVDEPAEARTRLEGAVDDVLRALHPRPEVTFLVVAGATDEELVEAAHQAQVLVLGRPLTDDHWILPRRLAEECSCPVVMVDRWGAAELVSSGSTVLPN